MKESICRLSGQLARRLEQISEFSGKCVSWLVFVLVLLIGYDVAMRYFFSRGSVAIQEMEWHLFSVIFLIGAAYTLKHDDHVRLDLVYQSTWMSAHRRAWVDLLGSLLFLVPFCILILATASPFAYHSYLHLEGSPDPGGLPWRWVLKAMVPLGFVFLLLQGIADTLKNLTRILGKEQ